MYTSFLATIKFAGKRILNLIFPSFLEMNTFLQGGEVTFHWKHVFLIRKDYFYFLIKKNITIIIILGLLSIFW